MTNPNLGLQFNKEYYGHVTSFQEDKIKAFEKDFLRKNNTLISTPFQTSDALVIEDTGIQSLHFKTTYPGLVIGLGYGHGSKLLGEIKMGFYFDYTSGQPVLPGSSMKGILRSVFPQPKDSEKRKAAKIAYLESQLRKITSKKIDLDKLEKNIFDGCDIEGKPMSVYSRDIFHDTYITGGCEALQNRFMGLDAITKHRPNLLKNPTPLIFLKILPGVSIRSDFQLHDFVDTDKEILLSANEKLILFKNILLDIGIGAKTNTGYGQLVSK